MITINNTEELFEDNYDIESQYIDYKIIKSYDVYLYPNNIITPRVKLKLGIGYLLENNIFAIVICRGIFRWRGSTDQTLTQS